MLGSIEIIEKTTSYGVGEGSNARALVEEIRTIIDQCAVPVECLKIWGCTK